jgi:superfamily II DNA or RNA helicase
MRSTRHAPTTVHNLHVEEDESYCTTSGVVHNCDLFPTRVFGTVLPMFPARYRIAATATLKRKDGMSDLLAWHVGEVEGRMMTPDVIPDVYPILWNEVPPQRFLFPDAEAPDDPRKARVSYTRMMQALAGDGRRNVMLAKYVLDAWRKGRKVLVLSHHVRHVGLLAERLLQDAAPPKSEEVGFFTGEQLPEELAYSRTCPIILGTYKMMGRGVDIPEIDALILALPIADPTQPVGRVLREAPGKKTPVVVDPVDRRVAVLVDMFKARVRWYTTLGAGGSWPRVCRQLREGGSTLGEAR